MLANILRQIHPPSTRSLIAYTGSVPEAIALTVPASSPYTVTVSGVTANHVASGRITTVGYEANLIQVSSAPDAALEFRLTTNTVTFNSTEAGRSASLTILLPVRDADGILSYVGNIDLSRDAVLMGVQGWSLDLESYRVTIASTTEPSISPPWWISTDGGTTRRRAIARYKQPGIWQGQITHWWVYLQLEPEA